MPVCAVDFSNSASNFCPLLTNVWANINLINVIFVNNMYNNANKDISV